MVRFEVRDEEGQCLYVCMCVECRSGNERGVRTCVCDCVCVTVYVCECVCVCDIVSVCVCVICVWSIRVEVREEEKE